METCSSWNLICLAASEAFYLAVKHLGKSSFEKAQEQIENKRITCEIEKKTFRRKY
jgi:hypothetical protein